MLLHIAESYLWLPVDKNEPEVKLHFSCGGVKFQEVDIQLGGTDRDFYTFMDVSKYLGRDITIEGNEEENKLQHIFCCGERVQNVYPFRPQIHFAAKAGWINDPNGLVFADGVYHLYYQWNPYGIIWGNMHWGHAVSKDMLVWEHKPMAMEPDVYGTIFSGCGWQDKNNAAGFGKNALLFFYTASGGSNQWSADSGNLYTQRLAVSLDGGETLQKTDGVILGHIAAGNRDPKIFYHAKSSAYVMVLFLDAYEFAVFRSADLLQWRETQRFSAEGMQECPDLFELPVVGGTEEKKWVFWSADGYYLVGDFDGYRFTPESEVLSAYCTRLPYAAQTYAGTDDRTISVAWLRMENERGNYRGMMAIPAELSLVKVERKARSTVESESAKADMGDKNDNGYQIRFSLIEELIKRRRPCEKLRLHEKNLKFPLKGKPMEVVLKWGVQKTGYTRVLIGNIRFDMQFGEGRIQVINQETHTEIAAIAFDTGSSFDMDIIIDQGVIEFYGNDGVIYGAVEPEENILQKKFALETEVEIEAVQIYEILNVS